MPTQHRDGYFVHWDEALKFAPDDSFAITWNRKMEVTQVDPKREELERAVRDTGLLMLMEDDSCGGTHRCAVCSSMKRNHMDALRALRDYLARPVWEAEEKQSSGYPTGDGIVRRSDDSLIRVYGRGGMTGNAALRDRVLRLLNESEKPDRSF